MIALRCHRLFHGLFHVCRALPQASFQRELCVAPVLLLQRQSSQKGECIGFCTFHLPFAPTITSRSIALLARIHAIVS